jgi:hypothetical protein
VVGAEGCQVEQNGSELVPRLRASKPGRLSRHLGPQPLITEQILESTGEIFRGGRNAEQGASRPGLLKVTGVVLLLVATGRYQWDEN